jgi:1-acyl-sn-glycerol-3-phosphate acyltransferase
VADARRIAQKVQAGHSLLFFPEGTFTRMPGLLPFHMGAFVAAAEAAAPVVPVTIRGTRSILRAGSWFPHTGTVSVLVGEPVIPEGTDWAAAVKLRDAARRAILRQLAEPDLALERPMQ